MSLKTTNVNSASYTALTAKSVCQEIEIYEDNQAGTTDYYLSDTGSDSDRGTRPAGSKTLFRSGQYNPGAIVVYVKTAVGSVLFAQEERWFG